MEKGELHTYYANLGLSNIELYYTQTMGAARELVGAIDINDERARGRAVRALSDCIKGFFATETERILEYAELEAKRRGQKIPAGYWGMFADWFNCGNYCTNWDNIAADFIETAIYEKTHDAV